MVLAQQVRQLPAEVLAAVVVDRDDIQRCVTCEPADLANIAPGQVEQPSRRRVAEAGAASPAILPSRV